MRSERQLHFFGDFMLYNVRLTFDLRLTYGSILYMGTFLFGLTYCWIYSIPFVHSFLFSPPSYVFSLLSAFWIYKTKGKSFRLVKSVSLQNS